MNGHTKVNGDGAIEATSTQTSIVQTKSDINSNTTIMDVTTTTTTAKQGFRLNGNRFAEHEEYSTGKKKKMCRNLYVIAFKSKIRTWFLVFVREFWLLGTSPRDDVSLGVIRQCVCVCACEHECILVVPPAPKMN